MNENSAIEESHKSLTLLTVLEKCSSSIEVASCELQNDDHLSPPARGPPHPANRTHIHARTHEERDTTFPLTDSQIVGINSGEARMNSLPSPGHVLIGQYYKTK